MRENKTCPDQGWKQMPTEKLDQILQAELRKEHPNEEVVLPILQTLEERERGSLAENLPEDLTKLHTLSEHNTSSKQSILRRRWISGIAAVAAVACVIVMAFPRTVGAESFWDVLFRWTSTIFEFVDLDQDTTYPNNQSTFATDYPGLQQLYDKVSELGVTEPVVPTWLPDGFVLSELKGFSMSDGDKLYGRFHNGRNNISITYRISSDIATKFEKEDTSVEVYDYGDVRHFILENDENISVTWSVDGVECSILTDMPKDDLYNVIKSIYRRSLE